MFAFLIEQKDIFRKQLPHLFNNDIFFSIHSLINSLVLKKGIISQILVNVPEEYAFKPFGNSTLICEKIFQIGQNPISNFIQNTLYFWVFCTKLTGVPDLFGKSWKIFGFPTGIRSLYLLNKKQVNACKVIRKDSGFLLGFLSRETEQGL